MVDESAGRSPGEATHRAGGRSRLGNAHREVATSRRRATGSADRRSLGRPRASRPTERRPELPAFGASAIIYGRQPVMEALRGNEALSRILLAHGANISGRLAELLAHAESRHVPVEWVPRAVLDRAVAGMGSGQHQGVVALAGEFRYVDLMTILAEALRRGEAPFLLALDALQDVNNLAGLLRTAVAVGVHGVVLPDRGAATITPAVRKASAGAVAHIAVARLAFLQALDELRRRGVRVVGLAMDAETLYTEVDWRRPVAIVVGGEAHGLRRGVARRCDQRVRLPMVGPIDSLNANVAGSIVLYEALRQRRGAQPDKPRGGGRLM